MNRSEEMTVLLELLRKLREFNSWCGETHLQKAMYFLESAAGIPLDYEFVLYKHGPFSFSFREALSKARSLGFVDMQQNPPYGPRYCLTDIGEAYLCNNKERVSSWLGKIRAVAECLGDKKVLQLEKLGTALLVTRQMSGTDIYTRADRLHQIKPHVSREEAINALTELEEVILPSVMSSSLSD